MGTTIRIVVCGGGNAAHVLAPTIKKASGAWVGILAPFEDEAHRMKAGVASGGIVAAFAGTEIRGVPDAVTSSPGDIIPSADIVILALPAFAHSAVIRSVAPWLKRGAWLGAMPSRSGFEFYGADPEIRARDITLFGFQTLPWACRIAEYGKRVMVMGRKVSVGVGARPAARAAEICETLQRIVGMPFHPVESMLSISLGNVGQIIHPGIMYSLFFGKEEACYDEGSVPPFYLSVTDESAGMLERMSEEILLVSRDLADKSDGRLTLKDVVSLRQWLLDSYRDQIADTSTLRSCFVSNSAYSGLKAPVVKKGPAFRPDFRSRYLTEDVPFGLVVTKGIADICGVATPTIDKVVDVTSRWIGAEYYAGGKPAGKHIGESRHPSNFGIDSIDSLLGKVL